MLVHDINGVNGLNSSHEDLPHTSPGSHTQSHAVEVMKEHIDAPQQVAEMTDDAYAVLCFRNLIYDICMHNGGGHAGSAVGMAAIGVALWKYILRFNPTDPEWFDRDRFVLSNGHASMFLYAMNHVVGYDAWTMDELKGYGDAKLNGYKTIAHAHPEIEVPGVEVTTGPLGQGIANAVGLAIASKNLGATFNRSNHEVIQSRIYCMTGDGCLMEGVALEGICKIPLSRRHVLTRIFSDIFGWSPGTGQSRATI